MKKTAILERLNAFSESRLNAEYKRLVQKLVGNMAKEMPSPLLIGRPDVWAAGIAYAIGSYNFLFDESFRPFINPTDIFAGFGVSPATAVQKAAVIRARYGITPPSKEYATRRTHDTSPHTEFPLSHLHQAGMTFMLNGRLAYFGYFADASAGFFLSQHFLWKPPSERTKGEFVDHDHDVSDDFSELQQKTEHLPAKSVRRQLEELIHSDPDFYAPYTTLAEMLDDKGDAGDALREEASRRALKRISDKRGRLPKLLQWAWLENRHIVEALEDAALMHWRKGKTGEALDLFRILMRSDPDDELQLRYWLLAILCGAKSPEEHQGQFLTPEGYISSHIEAEWFENRSAEFPEEFPRRRRARKRRP